MTAAAHTCGTPPSMSCCACMDAYAPADDPNREAPATTLRDDLTKAIRKQASRGAYQMPFESQPYESFAVSLVEVVMPVIEAHWLRRGAS